MLNLVNLTDEVREKMLAEVNADIAAKRVYDCPRLNDSGKIAFPNLLVEAIKHGSDDSLATALEDGDCFKRTEMRNTKHGRIEAKIPVNANEVLAEGEFNRYYVRGLCLVAIEKQIPSLIVYRARESSVPREVSQRMIGTRIDAGSLLNDLRVNIGVDTALKLPPGPNSGLSVRLP